MLGAEHQWPSSCLALGEHFGGSTPLKLFSRATTFGGAALAVFILGLIHASLEDYGVTSTFRFPWLLAFMAGVVVAAYSLGLPDVGRFWPGVWRGGIAVVGGALLISVSQLVLGSSLLPRFVLFGSFLAVPATTGVGAALTGQSRRRQQKRDRVLAIVSPDDATTLGVDLGGRMERHASLVGVLSLESILDSQSPFVIAEHVADTGATILVLGTRAILDEHVIEQTAKLHTTGTRVRTLLGFYEEWIGKLPLAELERSALLFDIGDVHASAYRRTSRAMDVVFGLLGAVALVVLLPAFLIGNLIGNRGPLLYRQPRVGKNGTEFNILKLRSMTPNDGPTEWTADGDSRVTSFGRILRLSHLDELPQVVNILRGELSVVGPRPEQPHYVEQLTETIPFYQLRHLVQPGLTGWAQVNYRYGNSDFDSLEKVQFEFYYLRHQGLWIDLKIIARTLQSVIGLKGR